jgi:HD superfamily phosphohydrolase
MANGSPKTCFHLFESVYVHPVRPGPEAVVSVRFKHVVGVFVTVHIIGEKFQMKFNTQLFNSSQTAVLRCCSQ